MSPVCIECVIGCSDGVLAEYEGHRALGFAGNAVRCGDRPVRRHQGGGATTHEPTKTVNRDPGVFSGLRDRDKVGEVGQWSTHGSLSAAHDTLRPCHTALRAAARCGGRGAAWQRCWSRWSWSWQDAQSKPRPLRSSCQVPIPGLGRERSCFTAHSLTSKFLEQSLHRSCLSETSPTSGKPPGGGTYRMPAIHSSMVGPAAAPEASSSTAASWRGLAMLQTGRTRPSHPLIATEQDRPAAVKV
jgi:hypothetical protein